MIIFPSLANSLVPRIELGSDAFAIFRIDAKTLTHKPMKKVYHPDRNSRCTGIIQGINFAGYISNCAEQLNLAFDILSKERLKMTLVCSGKFLDLKPCFLLVSTLIRFCIVPWIQGISNRHPIIKHRLNRDFIGFHHRD